MTSNSVYIIKLKSKLKSNPFIEYTIKLKAKKEVTVYCHVFKNQQRDAILSLYSYFCRHNYVVIKLITLGVNLLN